MTHHLVQVFLLDHGPHSRLSDQRVSHHPVSAAFGYAFHQLVGDRALHDEPRVSAAVLSTVPEDALADSGCRGVQVVGVGHDDDRTLTAALQQDLLEVGIGRIPEEVAAYFGGAGEGHTVHVGVPSDGCAGRRAEAGNYVKHPVRNTGLYGKLGDTDGRQGSLLRRLDHAGVAGGQDRPQLPAGHHEWVVPGQYGANYANRLADHHAHLAWARRRELVVELVGRLSVPPQCGHQVRDVDTGTVADRLAGLQRLDDGQFVSVGFDQAGEPKDQLLSVDRGHSPPGSLLEGGTGCGDGTVHIVSVALGHLGQLLAGSWVEGGEGLPGDCLHASAADDGSGRGLNGGGQGRRIGEVGGHQAAPFGCGRLTPARSVIRTSQSRSSSHSRKTSRSRSTRLVGRVESAACRATRP